MNDLIRDSFVTRMNRREARSHKADPVAFEVVLAVTLGAVTALGYVVGLGDITR